MPLLQILHLKYLWHLQYCRKRNNFGMVSVSKYIVLMKFQFLSFFFCSPLTLTPPSLPSPSAQKLLLTNVVLYLYTYAHLPLPELSSSPIHSPLGSGIRWSRYCCTSRGAQELSGYIWRGFWDHEEILLSGEQRTLSKMTLGSTRMKLHIDGAWL